MANGIFRELAERYWTVGVSVVPIKPGTKQPSVESWSSFQANLPSPDRRNYWFANYGDHGVGLLLGTKVSPTHYIAAVDVDDDALVQVTQAVLGKCPSAKRGKKGITFFVLVPSDAKFKSTTLRGANGVGNIDILAGGRQTVIPPTLHPDTGAAYEWVGSDIADCDFETLPKFDDRKLHLLKIAVGSKHTAALIAGEATHDPGVAFVAELLSAGANDEEIHTIVRGLLPSNYRGNSLDELPGWIDSGREKGIGQPKPSKAPIDDSIAEKLQEQLDPIAYVEGDGFLRYGEGYWQHITDNEIDRRARDHLRLVRRKLTLVTPYFRPIRNCLSLNVERPGFGDYSGRVCLDNGTLEVASGELRDHAPNDELRYHLDIDYDADATCPTYEDQVTRTLMEDEKAISLFDEFAALTLVPDMRFQKALYLLGVGGSGKSTLLKVIEMMHDPSAVSVTPLTKIEDERHRTDLARKLVCISFDVQTDRKVFGETFIRITGGDPITTRRLYSEVDGHVMPTVRFVGSMNPDMPGFIASPDALERRLILLPCGEQIADPDPDQFDQIKAERAGILARWVKALQRLYDRGRFDLPKSARDEVAHYVRRQEDFDIFAGEQLISDATATMPIAEITREFNDWADDLGAAHLSSIVVGRKLRRLGFKAGFERIERNGRKINTQIAQVQMRRDASPSDRKSDY